MREGLLALVLLCGCGGRPAPEKFSHSPETPVQGEELTFIARPEGDREPAVLVQFAGERQSNPQRLVMTEEGGRFTVSVRIPDWAAGVRFRLEGAGNPRGTLLPVANGDGVVPPEHTILLAWEELEGKLVIERDEGSALMLFKEALEAEPGNGGALAGALYARYLTAQERGAREALREEALSLVLRGGTGPGELYSAYRAFHGMGLDSAAQVMFLRLTDGYAGSYWSDKAGFEKALSSGDEESLIAHTGGTFGARALYNLAILASERGEAAAAESLLTLAEQNLPPDPWLLLFRAELEEELGRPPSLWARRIQLALELSHRKSFWFAPWMEPAARSALCSSLAARCYAGLGRAALASGEPKRASRYADLVIESEEHPLFGEAYFIKAGAQLALGLYAEAAHLFALSLAYRPEYPPAVAALDSLLSDTALRFKPQYEEAPNLTVTLSSGETYTPEYDSVKSVALGFFGPPGAGREEQFYRFLALAQEHADVRFVALFPGDAPTPDPTPANLLLAPDAQGAFRAFRILRLPTAALLHGEGLSYLGFGPGWEAGLLGALRAVEQEGLVGRK